MSAGQHGLTSHASTWTIVVILVPLFYLASWPVLMAFHDARKFPPSAFVATFYRPAKFVYETTPLGKPMHRVWRWSYDAWGGPPMVK